MYVVTRDHRQCSHRQLSSSRTVGVLDFSLLQVFGDIVDSILLLSLLVFSGNVSIHASVLLCDFLRPFLTATFGCVKCWSFVGFLLKTLDLSLGLGDVLLIVSIVFIRENLSLLSQSHQPGSSSTQQP